MSQFKFSGHHKTVLRKFILLMSHTFPVSAFSSLTSCDPSVFLLCTCSCLIKCCFSLCAPSSLSCPLAELLRLQGHHYNTSILYDNNLSTEPSFTSWICWWPSFCTESSIVSFSIPAFKIPFKICCLIVLHKVLRYTVEVLAFKKLVIHRNTKLLETKIWYSNCTCVFFFITVFHCGIVTYKLSKSSIVVDQLSVGANLTNLTIFHGNDNITLRQVSQPVSDKYSCLPKTLAIIPLPI